jgi:hypothetical protein
LVSATGGGLQPLTFLAVEGFRVFFEVEESRSGLRGGKMSELSEFQAGGRRSLVSLLLLFLPLSCRHHHLNARSCPRLLFLSSFQLASVDRSGASGPGRVCARWTDASGKQGTGGKGEEKEREKERAGESVTDKLKCKKKHPVFLFRLTGSAHDDGAPARRDDAG